MSGANRVARGSIKIPWNAFGYDRLPERFSRSQPGTKRKKQRRKQKDWTIVRGDFVVILDGKDKGKQGRVKEIVRSGNTLLVTGLNTELQRLEASEEIAGTYVRVEAPLLYSQVALVDPGDNQPTTVDYRYTENGERVRVSDRTGRIIIKPPWERRDWKERSVLKDGPLDTSPVAVTQSTYLPSLLHFHEEIMLIHGIKPSVPKTEPSLRDLILKKLGQCEATTPNTKDDETEPGLMKKIYQNISSKLPFFTLK